MFIANFGAEDSISMQNDYKYKIVFIYPPGQSAKSVPIPTAVRKENTLTFYFKKRPDDESFKKICKLANGEFVNPCPHITNRVGGVKYEQYEKNLADNWEQIKIE
jgi:hypothetical protein